MVSISWETSEHDSSSRPPACRSRLPKVPGTAAPHPNLQQHMHLRTHIRCCVLCALDLAACAGRLSRRRRPALPLVGRVWPAPATKEPIGPHAHATPPVPRLAAPRGPTGCRLATRSHSRQTILLHCLHSQASPAPDTPTAATSPQVPGTNLPHRHSRRP